MKAFLFSLLVCCFFCEANSQYSRLIVQLKDKGSNTYSIANPSQYLGSRALQRRTRFSIGIDSTDLPVTKRYMDSIRSVSNVTVLSISKWLNRVLIQTTDPVAIAKIQGFPFVASVNNSAPRMAHTPRTEKFKEEIKPIGTVLRTDQTLSNTYTYGSNYAQVHIHEGEFLHNKGFSGQGMMITVLDAGFNSYLTVTAFDSIRMNGQVLGERDFVAFDNSVNEDDNHGMYCLSTMAANWPGQMVGTSPKANYWLVRTENAPNEYPVEEFNWVVGAEFADSTGTDLITSSLGYTTFDDATFDHTYADFYNNSATSTKGAELAAKKGMIITNSAGNEGSSTWRYLGFPSDGDSVCAVGAVDTAGHIASFSSRGYPGKIKPNIASVGYNTTIAGFNNQPAHGSGTSFSNPNIAGLITCLWQAFPMLSNMKILDAVYRSADRYAAPDSAYGFGIPNFRKAYRLIRHDQNVALYGNNWLFGTPNPFTNYIDAKFIGRLDGNAMLYLKNSAGQIIAQQSFTTEEEEIYNYTFNGLASQPSGVYTLEYSDGTNTGSISLQKGIVSPVRILLFTGTVAAHEIRLQWKTAEEMNVKYYEVERSTDGLHYSAIGRVAVLPAASQNEYAFTDKEPQSVAYYRLKVVDEDGTYSLSNIIRLKYNLHQLFVTYNMINHILNIETQAATSQPLQVIIYSMDGKIILQKQHFLQAGSNDINMSLGELPQGLYVITAETKDDKKTVKVKR